MWSLHFNVLLIKHSNRRQITLKTKIFRAYEEINVKIIVFVNCIMNKSDGNVCNILKKNSAYIIGSKNNAHFIGLFWRLNELIHAKYFTQVLVHSTCSISYYYYTIFPILAEYLRFSKFKFVGQEHKYMWLLKRFFSFLQICNLFKVVLCPVCVYIHVYVCCVCMCVARGCL